MTVQFFPHPNMGMGNELSGCGGMHRRDRAMLKTIGQGGRFGGTMPANVLKQESRLALRGKHVRFAIYIAGSGLLSATGIFVCGVGFLLTFCFLTPALHIGVIDAVGTRSEHVERFLNA